MKDLPNWVIHVVEVHERIAGVCLVMEYQPGGMKQHAVGVTVDLILAYAVQPSDILHPPESRQTFTSKAEEYLSHDIEHYVNRGDVYVLVKNLDWDLGIVENHIIQQVSMEKRRGHRVAKYLLQYLLRKCEFRQGIDLEIHTKALFGLDPMVKSYQLRQCFLHLLIHVENTELDKELNDGILTLTLLDMLRYKYALGKFDYGYTTHVLSGHTEYFNRASFHSREPSE